MEKKNKNHIRRKSGKGFSKNSSSRVTDASCPKRYTNSQHSEQWNAKKLQLIIVDQEHYLVSFFVLNFSSNSIDEKQHLDNSLIV